MRLCGPSFRCVLKRIKRRRRKGTLNCREIATAAMLVTGFLPFIAGPPAAADARVVLDFGDSLTAGLGLPRENAFPVRLEARLNSQGFAVRVVNGSIRRYDSGRACKARSGAGTGEARYGDSGAGRQ